MKLRYFRTILAHFRDLGLNKAISNAGKPISRLRKSGKYAEIAKITEIMRKVPFKNKEIIVLNSTTK